METKVRIVTETERIAFGYWDQEAYDGKGDWIEPTGNSEIEQAAKKLQCSEELLNAVISSIEILKENIIGDLVDIWERLRRLEKGK